MAEEMIVDFSVCYCGNVWKDFTVDFAMHYCSNLSIPVSLSVEGE